MGEPDIVEVGSLRARVFDTPGHTAGHICYWLEKEKLLFSADTLFALGCGRPFERPAAVLWQSLLKLRKLPDDTTIYCGHEYTLANARFSVTVDPANKSLKGASCRNRKSPRRREADDPFDHGRRTRHEPVLARGRSGDRDGRRLGGLGSGCCLHRDPRTQKQFPWLNGRWRI